MASVVDVCNDALDKLGHNPITSLDDGDTTANLCARKWPIVRDRALRSYPWNFAVKRTTTSPETTSPSWGYTYQHPLPADCLRVLEILDMRTDEYEIEDNMILCDASVVYLRYIQKVTDPNKYDPMYLDAVASLMAYEMCEKLAQSNQKKDALWQEYNDALMKARSVDAQENPVQQFEEDSWIEARY